MPTSTGSDAPLAPSSRRPASVRVVVALAALSLGGAATAACGARGPLDDTPLDAGTSLNEADATPNSEDDANVDAASTPRDSGSDSGKVEDSPIACGTCLLTDCGPGISACLQSETCRGVLQCIAGTCLGGGGTPDPACAIGCANGDLTAIASVLQVFQCVTETCGGQCSSSFESVLGLLGELDGLGGDGGLGSGNGPRPDGGAGNGDGGPFPPR